MSDVILGNEPLIRLAVFLGVFSLMALWETASPRRRRDIPRLLRWSGNLGLVAINTALLRVAFPILAVGAAMLAAEQGWGLFNRIELPAWLAILVSVALLDFAVYAQHVMFHFVPWFWRLHRLHHADLDFDVTTALRFHPLEIMLSMAIKLAVVVLLGAPPVAVVVFEILLNAIAMFNHANLRLPESVDRRLRLLIVTPDMHRVIVQRRGGPVGRVGIGLQPVLAHDDRIDRNRARIGDKVCQVKRDLRVGRLVMPLGRADGAYRAIARQFHHIGRDERLC